MKEYSNRVTNLEGNIDKYLQEKTSKQLSRTEPNQIPAEVPPTIPDRTTQPKVLLMHDSICGKINNTICSKENIDVEKVWAPNVSKLSEEIDKIENNVDVIVIHTMTNDLKDKSVENISNEMSQAVEQGLAKTKKIILSTIVSRDDDETLNAKAAAVNANIKVKFLSNPRVIISINENVKDKKFRYDKIHLMDHGVSRRLII